MAIVVTNGAAVATSMDIEAAETSAKAAALLSDQAHLLAEDWRSRVTQRTGATAASIEVDGNSVGSDAPNMHRLEEGFHGADSLGRFYDQAAQPALGPAFDQLVVEFETALDTIVAESLGF
jgi:squalene cyclase